ncbi:MAG: hypothetical protein AB1465_06015 [Patescibacteria group bacterium]
MKTHTQESKKTKKVLPCPWQGLRIGTVFLLCLAFLFVFGLLNFSSAKNNNPSVPPLAFLQPASTSSIVYAMNEPVTVQNWLAVGTKKNKGKLYVKGYLQNPNKNKPLRVKDNMKVKGNLVVYGNLTISGSSKLLGTGIIGAQTLGEGVVTAEKLANSAVTTEKIYDGVITTAKLVDSSVTSAKIQNGTITADDLASDSVTSAKIASGTITGSDIASSTITSSNIDFTTNGVVKAGVYVDTTIPASPTTTQQFNNLPGGTTITSTYGGTAGQYTLDFGATITSNYFQIIAHDTAADIVSVVRSISTSQLKLLFYDGGVPANPSSGFYVLVY